MSDRPIQPFEVGDTVYVSADDLQNQDNIYTVDSVYYEGTNWLIDITRNRDKRKFKKEVSIYFRKYLRQVVTNIWD